MGSQYPYRQKTLVASASYFKCHSQLYLIFHMTLNVSSSDSVVQGVRAPSQEKHDRQYTYKLKLWRFLVMCVPPRLS